MNIKNMSNVKKIEWALRIGVFGEFLGHGVFALQNKQSWYKYFDFFGISDPVMIKNMLLLVGIMDIFLAIMVLVKPIRLGILWMALWGLFTALIRWPLGPDPVWDFLNDGRTGERHSHFSLCWVLCQRHSKSGLDKRISVSFYLRKRSGS